MNILARTSCIAVCFLMGVASLVAQNSGSSDSTAKLIQDLYERGSYLSAEVEARRFLENRSLPDSLKIVAEQYLAFALVAQGKNASASDHFITILKIDSTFTLDPILTSPKILLVFNQARQQFWNQFNGNHSSNHAVSLMQPKGVSFRAVLFPGWEQIYQGRETKGYVLLSAGLVSLASTIYLDSERRKARSDYLAADTPELASSRYDRYNKLYKTEYYAGAAFILIYLYSQFDAFFDLPPSSSISVRIQPSPQLTMQVPL